jgi:type I restriction enzyme S subunit
MTDPHLPSGWTWITPADVAANERHALAIGPFGSNLKVSDYKDSGVPLVFVRSIRASNFGGNDGPCVSPAKAEELRAHSIRGDDILITKMGDPPGDSTVYPTRCPPAVITADCIKWRVDPLRATPWFFAYAIRTHAARQQIATMTKGVAQKKISLERFRAMRLPMAPLREQKAIVAAIESHFSRLDAATATLERVQRNLERYRASVLKAAVEGRLVPTEAELAKKEGRSYEPASVLLKRILTERRRRWEESELAKLMAKGKAPTDDRWKSRYVEPAAPDTTALPELPEGWCWASVDQIAQVGTGATPNRNSPRFWRGGVVPWVTSAVVNDSVVRAPTAYVTHAALAETNLSLYQPGTVLVAMYGEGRTRGRACVLAIEATTNQALAALELHGASHSLLSWLLSFLEHNYDALRKSASGGVQPNLNLSIVRSIVVPLPPLLEQHRIASEVDRSLTIAEMARGAVISSTSRLDRLRQSILKWAFEGRLVEQNS